MASDNQDNRSRKSRNYYVDYSKNNNRFKDRRRAPTGGYSNNSRFKETPEISFGNRGFLVTSVDEVKSYLEMRNIFEDYFEQLYKREEQKEESKSQAGEKTVEDELEDELKLLRVTRPFKQVKTYCRNTLFINIVRNFSHVDPILIVDKFFDELAEKREVRTSNTYKVLPILDTFRSSVACAKESVSSLLRGKFADQDSDIKYFIEFQSRGNYKMNPEDKQKMIEAIADTVTEIKPNWSVSRDEAEFMIVLVALKNVCCVAFLRNYFKRCKYNVIEFCKEFAPVEQAGDAQTQSTAGDKESSISTQVPESGDANE